MTSRPFAPFEFLIAWRYLRARRAEGGVSVMTWISLIGITLAVFALVATLAVRTGLRAETLRIILGAQAHHEVYFSETVSADGVRDRLIRDYDTVAARIAEVPGVTGAVPVVKGRLIANLRENNAPIDLVGIDPTALQSFPSIAAPERFDGHLSRLMDGIAIGEGVARGLGVRVGDVIQIISPNGARTAFGTQVRRSNYEVVYIFRSGQQFIDAARAYLPLDEAQVFLGKGDGVDQIDVRITDPEGIDGVAPDILAAAGEQAFGWTWRDRSGSALRALQLQDNALYILLFILVLIATLNIVSGLVMLVKNKGRDIGILRTIGLTEGAVLRVFVIVGASIGVLGTVLGAGLGALFAANIEHVYALMDTLTGNARAGLEAQGFFFPPAILRFGDLAAAVGMSLALTFVITIFPARRAARLNPVEALRYE